jgi:hypothetical protein
MSTRNICNECGKEADRLFLMLGLPDHANGWCASCVRSIGLVPEAKPCGHLLTANCGCEEYGHPFAQNGTVYVPFNGGAVLLSVATKHAILTGRVSAADRIVNEAINKGLL